MKNKWKAIWATIVAIVVGIGAGLIFWIKSKSGKINIKDGGIEVKRKSNGTQVLPQTPDLDKTLDEISKDIDA